MGQLISTTVKMKFTLIISLVLLKVALIDSGYIGCFRNYCFKLLTGGRTAFGDNSVAKCRSHCKGSKFFGLQYGRHCSCGNEFRAASTNKQPEGTCRYPCPGNPDEKCGGWALISLYKMDDDRSASLSNAEADCLDCGGEIPDITIRAGKDKTN